jgi:phenylalanyl-tRNA synthetase beta chain
MTVIADDARSRYRRHHGRRAVGRAGGHDRNLIECAYSYPGTIARTGQTLGLTSDARIRFERGVDPAFLDTGIAIATKLALELPAGKHRRLSARDRAPILRRPIEYAPERTLALAGLDVARDEQRSILGRLGFEVEGEDVWTVRPPSWRRDVSGAADIVEEIVRMHGIDKVPSTPLVRIAAVATPTATPEQMVERRVRRTAAAGGLSER